MQNRKTALLIGNSDGIGLELTRLLLSKGYKVSGISRSKSPIESESYRHFIQDVAHADFKLNLNQEIRSISKLDVCIYCAGIGGLLDFSKLDFETKVFQVNLLAAAIATEVVVGRMLEQGSGHFIGLSSIADVGISSGAPSYTASKAGISCYWEGLGLALKEKGVKLTNVRFGFVDTKMAKAPRRPLMITPQRAARFLLKIIDKPRLRATLPLSMGFLVWILNLPTRLRLVFQ